MTTALDQHTAAPADLVDAEEALLATVGVPVERHEVSVNGTRLHYLTCGEGEPLLLVHGRGGAGALFAPILAALAAHRRVIALDLPGWGLSEKPPFTGHTAEDALAIWRGGVLGLLDALSLDRVDLLGHSMGGFTALSVALEHPERVRRLVLVDSGGLGVNVQFDVRLYFWLVPERLHRRLGRRFFTYVLRRDNPRAALMSAALLDFAYAVQSQAEVIPSGAAASNAWVNLWGVHLDLRRRLREVDLPVLLLWGDRDRLTPYTDALKAARRLPYGRLVAFTGCGHTPYQERPDDFARVLLMWLDGAPVSSRV